MANTSQSLRRAALLVSAVAVLGLTTACGDGSGTVSSPQTQSGTAAPAGGDPSADGSGTAVSSSSGSDTATGTDSNSSGSSTSTSSSTGSNTSTASSSRCHTSELRANVGDNDPGAGQENFPIILTNMSGRTCTVRGFPGAAFVNASGTQLGPNPVRETSSTATTVTLKPGQSAWAGLTFSNPEISGAKTATPTTLVVTPPDEKDPLKVTWTNGAVPVSGNSSSVRLTVFSAGTGA
ncbi:DUF4232 domain-containing protein [Streptomyces sp. MBT53]|uniref:DUF4232 domain-containing protein n=1 Tax=Streptomyces sp. MBT53 TaxID=1488384 RepID=UPI00191240F4|nr:DUF4232 domain-containing protein [Streptomyces sp. MBT53]MBK6015506.1 DUF4232 domain-containing protein [Streptomyces sp. MBT53]